MKIKNAILIMAGIAILTGTAAAYGDNLITLNTSIRAVRTAVATADSAITTYDYATWTTTVGTNRLPRPGPWNKLLIESYAVGTENTEIPYLAFIKWPGTYGHFQLAAQGSLYIGSLAVTKDPLTGATSTAKWCDTATNTLSDLWPMPWEIYDSGYNRIVMFVVDTWPGFDEITFWFPTLPASTTVTVIAMGG